MKDLINIVIIIMRYNILRINEIIAKVFLNIGYFKLTKAKALVYGVNNTKQDEISKFLNNILYF